MLTLPHLILLSLQFETFIDSFLIPCNHELNIFILKTGNFTLTLGNDKKLCQLTSIRKN